MLLNCWRRLLRVPWTARKSNQSILKEISPEYSLEGLMLKLKLQYFDHLMRRADSLERTLMLGKIEGKSRKGREGWDGRMASPTQWPWVWVNSRSWWWTGRPGMLQSMGSQRVGHDWATELNCGSGSGITFPLLVTNWKIISSPTQTSEWGTLCLFWCPCHHRDFLYSFSNCNKTFVTRSSECLKPRLRS